MRIGTSVPIPKDRLGSLALEWCGYAYIYAFVWLLVVSLRRTILSIPEVGESVFNILSWLAFVFLPLAGLAVVGLGLFAAVHALVTRGSARQALAGLLAVALCVAGAFGLWWLGAEQWTAVIGSLRGE